MKSAVEAYNSDDANGLVKLKSCVSKYVDNGDDSIASLIQDASKLLTDANDVLEILTRLVEDHCGVDGDLNYSWIGAGIVNSLHGLVTSNVSSTHRSEDAVTISKVLEELTSLWSRLKGDIGAAEIKETQSQSSVEDCRVKLNRAERIDNQILAFQSSLSSLEEVKRSCDEICGHENERLLSLKSDLASVEKNMKLIKEELDALKEIETGNDSSLPVDEYRQSLIEKLSCELSQQQEISASLESEIDQSKISIAKLNSGVSDVVNSAIPQFDKFGVEDREKQLEEEEQLLNQRRDELVDLKIRLDSLSSTIDVLNRGRQELVEEDNLLLKAIEEEGISALSDEDKVSWFLTKLGYGDWIEPFVRADFVYGDVLVKLRDSNIFGVLEADEVKFGRIRRFVLAVKFVSENRKIPFHYMQSGGSSVEDVGSTNDNQDICSWSIAQVSRFCEESKGIRSETVSLLRENDVSGDVFLSLSKDDIESNIGVSVPGQVIMLYSVVDELNSKSSSSAKSSSPEQEFIVIGKFGNHDVRSDAFSVAVKSSDQSSQAIILDGWTRNTKRTEVKAKFSPVKDQYDREIRSLKKTLKCSWVVDLIDYDESVLSSNLNVIITEKAVCDFRVLMDQYRMNDGGNWTVKVMDFARQCLRGISDIHSCGLVWCDVKPENFLVFERPTGCAGLTMKTIKAADLDSCVEPGEVRVGGTVHYQSPDVVRNGLSAKADIGQDIWAYGMMLYEMNIPGGYFSASLSDVEVADQLEDPNFSVDLEALGNGNNSLSSVLSLCFELDPVKRSRTQLLSKSYFNSDRKSSSMIYLLEKSLSNVSSLSELTEEARTISLALSEMQDQQKADAVKQQLSALESCSNQESSAADIDQIKKILMKILRS